MPSRGPLLPPSHAWRTQLSGAGMPSAERRPSVLVRKLAGWFCGLLAAMHTALQAMWAQAGS